MLVYNTPMRILINAVSARAGGGVAYLLNLLEWLPAISPESYFIFAVPEMNIPEACKEYKNIEILQIKKASGNLISRYLWENTGLISLCKEKKADLLFCVANIMPLINPGIPVVVMVQNVAPLTPKVRKLLFKFEPLAKTLQMLSLQWLTLHALRNADKIISLSHATAELLKKWVPGLESDVLYHGTSPMFNPSAPATLKRLKKPYFLFVSNLYVYKGLEYIVDALAHDRTLPPVYVAGKEFDLGYLKMVKQRAIDAKVTDRIIFLDKVPYNQLPGLYANAEAMVYTSWCENCPNILLESMGCSCPVVAMDIGPMPEICEKSAEYAKPFDGISLAQAMSRLLNRDRKSSRSQAIEQSQKFTWEIAMRQHIKSFANVLKK